MARRKPVGGTESMPPTGINVAESSVVMPPEDVAADDVDVDPESAARTICLRLLTAKSRSRAQLETALAKRNVPTEAATRVLDRLTDVGLINDAAFAEQFVSIRHADRGLAARELRRQLSTSGVSDEIAVAATAGIDDESDRHTARLLVDRKLRTMAALEPHVQVRRLVGMLARKGYSSAVCYAVVREAVDGAAEQLGNPDDIASDFA